MVLPVIVIAYRYSFCLRMTKPLKWCVDWKHLRPMEQMMMWFPLVGTQRLIYADLVRQLKTRTQDDMSTWEICLNVVPIDTKA